MNIQEILKSKYPFEDYLKWLHAEEYMGTDDDMPDSFDSWVTELQGDDLIEHGNVLTKLLIDNFVK